MAFGRRLGPALAGWTLWLGASAAAEPLADVATRRAVLFGTLEAGPHKRFVSAGAKAALGAGSSLDAGGFRVLLKLGASREPAGRDQPRGRIDKVEAQALLGYEWRFGDTFVALYGGLDVEHAHDDRALGTGSRTRPGGRVQFDLWSQPTADTMLQAAGYLSSGDERFWGRLAGGLRLGGGLFAGPEIEAYRDLGYDKLRLGLHLTGVELLGTVWRISGGIERSRDRADQGYVTLGLHWRR